VWGRIGRIEDRKRGNKKGKYQPLYEVRQEQFCEPVKASRDPKHPHRHPLASSRPEPECVFWAPGYEIVS